MSSRWTADYIIFLAEHTLNKRPPCHDQINLVHAFVPLDFARLSKDAIAADKEFVPFEGLVHWAPRICSLGVILTSVLGAKLMDVTTQDTSTSHSWQEALNTEVFECHAAISRPEWPALEIKNDIVRSFLRAVVKTCLDSSVFNIANTSEAQRRARLYTDVVWPLQYVVELAKDEKSKASWIEQLPTAQCSPVSSAPKSDFGNLRLDEISAQVRDVSLYTDVYARDNLRQHNGHMIAQNYYERYDPPVASS